VGILVASTLLHAFKSDKSEQRVRGLERLRLTFAGSRLARTYRRSLSPTAPFAEFR
jgi:hypothetical protein